MEVEGDHAKRRAVSLAALGSGLHDALKDEPHGTLMRRLLVLNERQEGHRPIAAQRERESEGDRARERERPSTPAPKLRVAPPCLVNRCCASLLACWRSGAAQAPLTPYIDPRSNL